MKLASGAFHIVSKIRELLPTGKAAFAVTVPMWTGTIKKTGTGPAFSLIVGDTECCVVATDYRCCGCVSQNRIDRFG